MLVGQRIAQADPEYQVLTIMDEATRDTDLILLGRALHILRDRADITQKQLAALLEMDATYISRIERGRRGVQWLTVQRFLRALDADLHQLAEAIGEAKEAQSSQADR